MIVSLMFKPKAFHVLSVVTIESILVETDGKASPNSEMYDLKDLLRTSSDREFPHTIQV